MPAKPTSLTQRINRLVTFFTILGVIYIGIQTIQKVHYLTQGDSKDGELLTERIASAGAAQSEIINSLDFNSDIRDGFWVVPDSRWKVRLTEVTEAKLADHILNFDPPESKLIAEPNSDEVNFAALIRSVAEQKQHTESSFSYLIERPKYKLRAYSAIYKEQEYISGGMAAFLKPNGLWQMAELVEQEKSSNSNPSSGFFPELDSLLNKICTRVDVQGDPVLEMSTLSCSQEEFLNLLVQQNWNVRINPHGQPWDFDHIATKDGVSLRLLIAQNENPFDILVAVRY